MQVCGHITFHQHELFPIYSAKVKQPASTIARVPGHLQHPKVLQEWELSEDAISHAALQ